MQRIFKLFKPEIINDNKIVLVDQVTKTQAVANDEPYDFTLAPTELNDKIVEVRNSNNALIENITKPFTFFICMFFPALLMQYALQPNSYLASLFVFFQKRTAEELASSIIALRSREFSFKEQALGYTHDLAQYLYPGVQSQNVDLVQYGYVNCLTERAEYFDMNNFTGADLQLLISVKDYYVTAYVRLLQVINAEQRGAETKDYFTLKEEKILDQPINNYGLLTGIPEVNVNLLKKKSFIELSRLIKNKYTFVADLLAYHKLNPTAIYVLEAQDIQQSTLTSTKQNFNVGFILTGSMGDYVLGRIISILIRKLITCRDKNLKTPTVTQAKKIIESLENKNVFLQNIYGYSAWFTAAMLVFSLWHTVSKYLNSEEENPALYVVLMSNIITSICEMYNYNRLHQEKLNEIFYNTELSKNLKCFNEAVAATNTTWTLNKSVQITKSEFIFSPDPKKTRYPSKVNEAVKKVFANNGIELTEKKSPDSLKIGGLHHLDDPEIINDQISSKLKKLNSPIKPDHQGCDSTSMTLTQLRNARKKHGVVSFNKQNLPFAKKESEVIISPDIKGKLIRRKKSLMFILLTDSNPDLTQRDLDRIPDRPARAHHQKGVKILVKGDIHPFWIKNWSDKRIPLDKTESITGLVDGVEKKIPTYMACKTIKKQ